MVNRTKIEWCDYTANPIRYRDEVGRPVWACVKASEGCAACDAETLAILAGANLRLGIFLERHPVVWMEVRSDA